MVPGITENTKTLDSMYKICHIYQSLPPKSTQRQVNRPYSELFGIYMNVKVAAQKNIVHVSDMENLFCSRNYNKMIQ